MRGVGDALDFEVFILGIILDRNSQVRFHKHMGTIGLRKSPVHDAVHGQSYINS